MFIWGIMWYKTYHVTFLYGHMELASDLPSQSEFQAGLDLAENDCVDNNKGSCRICCLRVNYWLKLVCLEGRCLSLCTLFLLCMFWRIPTCGYKTDYCTL